MPRLLLLLLLLLAPARAAAGPTSLLAEMPPPEQVSARLHGSDAFDTAARRSAALLHLAAMTQSLPGGRARAPRSAQRQRELIQAYEGAAAQTQRALLDGLPPAARAQPDAAERLERAVVSLTRDPEFQRQVLTAFFSAEFRATYKRVAAPLRPRNTAPAAAPALSTAAQVLDTLEPDLPPRWRWLKNRWLWCALLALWSLLGYRNLLQRPHADPQDPLLLTLGGARYRLSRHLGVVTDVQRWTEARQEQTQRTITLRRGFSVVGTTTIPETVTRLETRMQLMVQSASGQSEDFNWTRRKLPFSVGQGFAAVWAIREGDARGPFLFFHNYDLGRSEFCDELYSLLGPSLWPLFPLTAALLCAGLHGLAIAGVFIAGVVVDSTFTRRRRVLFMNELLPRIFEQLPDPRGR